MLQGRELAKEIQKRSCRIQPGMLVKSSGGSPVDKLALVVKSVRRLAKFEPRL